MATATVKLTPTEWQELPQEFRPELRYVASDLNYYMRGLFPEVNEALGGDWSLCNGDGKLLKRVGKAWFKVTGQSIARSLEGAVEAYVAERATAPVEWRLTEKLDWPMNSHGSTSSCFWTGNRHIRATLVDIGALGILTRNTQGTGVGRAFAIAVGNMLVVTNSRGPLNSTTLAQLLGKHLGMAGGPRYFGLDVATEHGVNRIKGYPHGFYLEGTSAIGGRGSSKTISTPGCFCSAKFSNTPHEGKLVCEHCPFNREKAWNRPSPFSCEMEDAE